MKEDIGGKSASAKPSPQKIFGTNSLQIAGDDDASRLVGSIVEKGISEDPQSRPLAVPRPTVFPFPVARHRSHGPHWAPKGSENSDGGDDKDSAESDLIAVFANPVQRKQKKGLDFSQWQQLINGDNFSVYPEKGTYKNLSVESMASKKLSSVSEILDHIDGHIEAKNGPLSSEMYGENNAKAQDVDMEKKMDLASFEDMPRNAIPETPAYVMENLEPRLLEVSKRKRQVSTENTSVAHITANAASNKFERGSISLESQIDAENSARLQRMCADEIAEAQAEILDRINPAVIEALRKRGQEKLKKKTISSSDVATKGVVDYVQNEEKLSKDTKDSPLSEVDNSCKVTTPASLETLHGQDHNAMEDSKPGSCTLWDVWCKRVEAVRELRFTLDGNVIENDLSSVPETGSVSVHSGYTAYNVSERDFLRTEGNPGAAGYTIKEALALSRSVIPGQRTIALHLLASVLDRASHNLTHNQVGCNMKDARIDWEAIWAFALGPEPELALLLRMCLDDNHKSVVLACAKVIQCILCCDINEGFFDTSEKTATYPKDAYTAPVFRSRQGIDVGFLRGGFWKYSAKSSNILPFEEDIVTDKTEGEHTIQDDIVVAGQDFAAGLVRMGILTRICYLLETDPSAALEESIISILIAIARHSPTCSNAIIKCQRLVQTVVDTFTMKDQVEITPSKIKSVILLKVLAQSEKKNCIEFIENGIFQKATWHLYRHTFSLDQWVQLGVENKLSLTLMVEQLRFWRVFIQHGYCVSNFSDMFPVLCVWLNVPSFEKLKKNDILGEFAAIATEAYLVLEALTRRLPNFYSYLHRTNEIAESVKEDMHTWFWSEVGPMVDLAIEWTAFRSNPYIANFFDYEIGSISDFPIQSLPVGSLLWVISAVMHMLSSLLKRVIPEDTIGLVGEYVPWLPEFVPKIGLEIIKNGFLSFSGLSGTENEKDQSGSGSFVRLLCHLRHQGEHETSIAAVCCLNGIVEVVVSVDKLIKLSKPVIHPPPSQNHNFMGDDMILANGLCESAVVEFKRMLSTFMELIASEWHDVHLIEAFGRGGPAPGVGLGWGFSGGGFWSTGALLAQTDARLLIHLLKIFQIVSSKDPPTIEEMDFIVQKLNSILGVCSIAGPRDGFIVDMALGILLEVPVLKCLDICIRHFLCQNKELKLFEWEYNEEDYHLCSKILASHFRKRWLCVKRKFKVMDRNTHAGRKTSKKNSGALDTIHEDFDTSGMTSQDHYCTSLVVEWAHQKLPLPMHWFLSPISTIGDTKHTDLPGASDILNDVQDITHFLEVAKCGIFFLLGVEAISSLLPIEIHSTVRSVPIVWKLHSLSMVLLVGMGVLEEERSRVVYETLQEIYGQLLNESRFKKRTQFILEKNEFSAETGGRCSEEFLSFQSEIHESYSTFMEALVEQFAAISYGDLIYGRQVAIYLHRCVEASVRLATWTALSNARVLELLPPLEKCFANAEGYLEPVEDNESILEAYAKSWVSGALDRAATRKSITFTLVLHHLSAFIFCRNAANLLLRNKLVKSLLRDYSRKQQHEAMMVDLIQYDKPLTSKKRGQEGGSSVEACEIEKRFNLMADSCERNSSLLSVVEKLKSSFQDNNLLQAW